MNQYGINCVQCKMECLFKVRIVNEESSKNPGQQYSVYASHELNDKVIYIYNDYYLYIDIYISDK